MKPGNLGADQCTGWCQFLQKPRFLKDKRRSLNLRAIVFSIKASSLMGRGFFHDCQHQGRGSHEIGNQVGADRQ
ncbi:hypothetical protein ATH33_1133 [Thermoactinomyces vulgaris]|nr:hypothetical protein ATH33_1133 [Thermoactinomyces vulgaris]